MLMKRAERLVGRGQCKMLEQFERQHVPARRRRTASQAAGSIVGENVMTNFYRCLGQDREPTVCEKVAQPGEDLLSKAEAVVRRLELQAAVCGQKQWEQANERKQRKMWNDLQLEKHKEMKEAADRVEEFKREEVIGRINQHREKTAVLQKRRQDMAKMHQLMRKDAAVVKYQARQEIEKALQKSKRPDLDARLSVADSRFMAGSSSKKWQNVSGEFGRESMRTAARTPMVGEPGWTYYGKTPSVRAKHQGGFI